MKLRLPPTTNHIYGQRGYQRYLTKEAKAWKEEAQWIYKTEWKQDMLVEAVRVNVNFYLKRDRDVDNLKLILDSLQGIVIANDSQVQALYIAKHKSSEPYVDIEVKTMI